MFRRNSAREKRKKVLKFADRVEQLATSLRKRGAELDELKVRAEHLGDAELLAEVARQEQKFRQDCAAAREVSKTLDEFLEGAKE